MRLPPICSCSSKEPSDFRVGPELRPNPSEVIAADAEGREWKVITKVPFVTEKELHNFFRRHEIRDLRQDVAAQRLDIFLMAQYVMSQRRFPLPGAFSVFPNFKN